MDYWQVMLASSLDEDMGVADDEDDAQMRLAIQESIRDYIPQACSDPWLPPNPIYADADPEALRTCAGSSLPTWSPFHQSPRPLVPVSSSKRKPHPFDYHPPPFKRSDSLLSSGSDDAMPPPSQRRRSSYSPLIRQRVNPFDSSPHFRTKNNTYYSLSSDEEDNPPLDLRPKTSFGLPAKQPSRNRPRSPALATPDDIVEGDM